MARSARRSGREAQIARLLVAGAAGAVLACASVGDPPGGPPDAAPPRIISIKPESGAVVPDFDDNLVIQFDETVEEQPSSGGGVGGGQVTGLAQQILLSPVAGPVKVSWHRSSISVKPKEGWKRRVYRLQVLPGFSDLRRNRFDSSATVLFSTGPEFGHARLGGIALRWVEQTVLLGALIEAVPLPDTVGYLTVADSGGQFNIENLRPGRYIVYATADQNGDRRRGIREAYDSVEVTLDSSSNVALFTFPHDTVPPRPRTATFVDSITVRVEFSQPLEPTQSFDTTTLHVLELPDSTPVALSHILSQRQYDSLQTAARAKADSEAAARDTTRAIRDSAAPARRPAPAPPAERPTDRPADRETRQYVDTALVRQLLARRPVPSDKIVIVLARPMKVDTRYVVRVQGATNLIGKKGDGDVSFTVPKPTPRDTTPQPRTPEP
ncbi:MAG TPA: Ig-like domain-containing protein [Gemmatimonadales bacterium]|nr:Ig-like domain-containing protein [Gemmatimonadales bacterium]